MQENENTNNFLESMPVEFQTYVYCSESNDVAEELFDAPYTLVKDEDCPEHLKKRSERKLFLDYFRSAVRSRIWLRCHGDLDFILAKLRMPPEHIDFEGSFPKNAIHAFGNYWKNHEKEQGYLNLNFMDTMFFFQNHKHIKYVEDILLCSGSLQRKSKRYNKMFPTLDLSMLFEFLTNSYHTDTAIIALSPEAKCSQDFQPNWCLDYLAKERQVKIVWCEPEELTEKMSEYPIKTTTVGGLIPVYSDNYMVITPFTYQNVHKPFLPALTA